MWARIHMGWLRDAEVHDSLRRRSTNSEIYELSGPLIVLQILHDTYGRHVSPDFGQPPPPLLPRNLWSTGATGAVSQRLTMAGNGGGEGSNGVGGGGGEAAPSISALAATAIGSVEPRLGPQERVCLLLFALLSPCTSLALSIFCLPAWSTSLYKWIPWCTATLHAF